MRDLDFLAEISRETMSSLTLSSLMWRVVTLLRKRFGYPFAAIGLVQEGVLLFRAGDGENFEDFEGTRDDERWRIPPGQGVAGRVITSGRSQRAHDVRELEKLAAPNVLASTRSQLCVPLSHKESVIGVIDVQAPTPDAFTDADSQLLEVVGALVAPAIEAAQMVEWERRRVRHLRLVNEISRLVMSSLDREQVVSLACRAMLDELHVSFVAIMLLDRSGRRMVQGGYATDYDFIEGVDFDNWSVRKGEGISSQVVQSEKPIRVGDVRVSDKYRKVVEGMRSCLAAPLRVMGETIGALVVEHTAIDHFNDEDEALAENLAGYLAQAIDNARLFDSQRRRWQQLLLINEVARIATRTIDLEAMVALVARDVHDRFRYFAVGVLLAEEGHLVVRALASDRNLDVEVGHRERLGESWAGMVIQTGRTLQVDNLEDVPRRWAFSEDTRSVICVPLGVGDQVIGAIQVESPEVAGFDGDDRLVLETLAKSVAGAIANARALRQTEQLREDLNRMIVHDLRNPVQAIQLTMQEVLSREELSKGVSAAVTESIKCTDDILQMINSLLDLARFEAGKARVRLSPAVLNDHIRDVLRRFSPLARSKQLQVTISLSQDVPVMRLDHDLINRMLGNLISNAIKFTPDGSTVTVTCNPIEKPTGKVPFPGVLIAVEDHGEGIPADYHQKIFEKFGQVESRQAGLKMSTGLGLALCRYVVEAHGGKIWVESELNVGSIFFVALPVAPRNTSSR